MTTTLQAQPNERPDGHIPSPLPLVLLLVVALPLLLLATLAQSFGTVTRRLTQLADNTSHMGDPFEDVPPQPVAFECRGEDCGLQHRTVVTTFEQVTDTVEYYDGQGHETYARFPNADDAIYPPEDD